MAIKLVICSQLTDSSRIWWMWIGTIGMAADSRESWKAQESLNRATSEEIDSAVDRNLDKDQLLGLQRPVLP